jgi:Mg2+-importing ATPase
MSSKYVSAWIEVSNFGNAARVQQPALLPFLPLLATQILLNNLLYDLSEIGIPFDTIDTADLARPQRWNMRAHHPICRRHGAAVLGLRRADLPHSPRGIPSRRTGVRTAWFLRSIATQSGRLRDPHPRPSWQSPPDRRLLLSAFFALAIALAVPFTIAGDGSPSASPVLSFSPRLAQ